MFRNKLQQLRKNCTTWSRGPILVAVRCEQTHTQGSIHAFLSMLDRTVVKRDWWASRYTRRRGAKETDMSDRVKMKDRRGGGEDGDDFPIVEVEKRWWEHDVRVPGRAVIYSDRVKDDRLEVCAKLPSGRIIRGRFFTPRELMLFWRYESKKSRDAGDTGDAGACLQIARELAKEYCLGAVDDFFPGESYVKPPGAMVH
jgi:hypothetical protein